MEALSNGAVAAVHLTIAVIANLIVFVALLAFLNAIIAWLGVLVGHDSWSLEVAFSNDSLVVQLDEAQSA